MYTMLLGKALERLERFLWRQKYKFIVRNFKVSEQELDYLYDIKEVIDAGALIGDLPLHLIRTVLVEMGTEANDIEILAEIYFRTAKLCLATPFHWLSKKYFLRSLEQKANMTVHAMYLNICVASPDETNESLFKKALAFGSLYGNRAVLGQKYNNVLKPSKVLKIGYVCGFFDNSIMRNGMLPTLAAHDRENLEIHCFSSGKIPQDMLSVADYWHDCQTLNDFQLACLIRDLEIDILRDLDGFIENNRLGMFAMKPAPIQIQGANYLATSGLPFFNWIITSECAVPPNEDHFYTERIYRNSPLLFGASIPNFGLTNYFPEPKFPPLKKNGYITFGYFGAGHKVNDETIKLWCDVLKLVPGCRFVFKCTYNESAQAREVYRASFQKHGVKADRLDLRGPSPHEKMLEEYGDIDIVLDSFPYTGGTTMLEALWMGVPVFSIKGERKASRSGAAVLKLIGLEDLIAENKDDFVSKASALGLDKRRLLFLRSDFRDRVSKHDFFDRDKFCREMETAYRQIWVTWCEDSTLKNIHQ